MYNKIRIIAVIGLIIGLIGIHLYDKHTAINKAVASVHLSYDVKFKEADVKAKTEKIKLIEDQQKERDKRDEKIKSLDNELSIALRLLSTREKRPKDSGESSQAGISCTGRELFREDGEFLVREAARADKVVVDRNYYYEQYEKARLMVERINNGN